MFHFQVARGNLVGRVKGFYTKSHFSTTCLMRERSMV